MRLRQRPAAILLAAIAIPAAMNCAAQQQRRIDGGSGHIVLSAAASIGGPKFIRGSAGVRFPLVPAGALHAAAVPASAHRRIGKPAPAKPSARPVRVDTGGRSNPVHGIGTPRRETAHAAARSSASHSSRGAVLKKKKPAPAAGKNRTVDAAPTPLKD